MKKKSKAEKKLKVSDLAAKSENPKGGATLQGGVTTVLADGSVRTVSDSTSTDLGGFKYNKN